jgi:hypothetical protein
MTSKSTGQGCFTHLIFAGCFFRMNYSEKLKHPKWQKKRLEILHRDNFTCVLCGDKETELHINHLKYTGEPYDAPNEDLETLCKVCHKLKHSLDNNHKIMEACKIKDIFGNNVLVYRDYLNDMFFANYDEDCNFDYITDSRKFNLLHKFKTGINKIING